MNSLLGLWAGIKTDWNKFEAWVASWLPGAKTKTIAVLGAVGNAAYFGQDYLTQLTGLNSNVITGSRLAIASLVLFTLAFWLRGIGDRAKSSAVVNP